MVFIYIVLSRTAYNQLNRVKLQNAYGSPPYWNVFSIQLSWCQGTSSECVLSSCSYYVRFIYIEYPLFENNSPCIHLSLALPRGVWYQILAAWFLTYLILHMLDIDVSFCAFPTQNIAEMLEVGTRSYRSSVLSQSYGQCCLGSPRCIGSCGYRLWAFCDEGL